jgi:arabinofuranosyltransferase
VRVRPRPADFALLALLVLLALLAVLPAYSRHFGGTEDALMLLRYSRHLAEGYGIRWNIGQAPVEGATDFLYMVSVAGWMRVFHQVAAKAAQQLLVCCWITLPLVVYACARFTLGARRLLAAALAVYIVFTPGGGFVESTFGAPFMMMLTALTWWVAVGFIAEAVPIGWAPSLLFSFLALLMGLTRPEANVLAVLFLAAVVFARGWKETRRLSLVFVLVMLVVGGSYFVWRWRYFGWLLPNPFYVKGRGHLHVQALVASLENTVKLLWPAIPPVLLAFRNDERTRLLKAMLIPVVGFAFVWVLLSNENNHMFRFQMPLVPVVLLFLPLLLENVLAEIPVQVGAASPRLRPALLGAFWVYVLSGAYTMYRSSEPGTVANSGRQFAEYLGSYKNRGYTMAVTEAGTFPFYSDWNAIDLLGLNDSAIAHHGVQQAELEQARPELLMYHLYSPNFSGGLLHGDQAGISRRDMQALIATHTFAAAHGYILAAAYGSDPCSLHVFYVRPGTRDTDAIVRYIRSTPYFFLDTGLLSVDHRSGVSPECHFLPGTY